MRQSIRLLAAVLGAGLLATSAQAEEPLRLAADVPYKPFEYSRPDGSLAGFDIELGNAICDYLERECEWVVQSWDGLIPGLRARKFDAIMSAMTISEVRRRQVLFSDSYFRMPSVWVARDGSDIDVADPASLAGKVVGVQTATLQDEYVTDLHGDSVEVRRYASWADVVTDMRAGRLDLAFMEYPTAQSFVQIDQADSDFQRLGELVREPDRYFAQGVGVAFRRRDRDLAERFNEALAALKADGTYDALVAKHFDAPDA
ncbi:transporter substrate-binding domain-containing protein [Halomonas koreensis]|uniref:Transporter substrate-binding domain-containing protein n=1 Tax=Halomonas koreensis TaxID=245385 RepID=A0ABU1FXL0_9GAMM|nr:transporter substrate-binding domain-containing protein [Halomonas koreensis]MDR5865424.1 transporter substrate-binding domain-containing protein [Halomonas koreensis]